MFRASGFTLVEMIIVIVITGIVASVVAVYIGGPVRGFVDTSRRAQLVDAAELALRRMARDIRRALPNSIRVDATGRVLEMLNTVDAGRYRDDPPPGTAAAVLDFSAADDEFDVIGTLNNFADIDANTDFVGIYNLAASGILNNAYFGDNRERLSSGLTTNSHIQLSSSKLFPLASSRQRFYVVDSPVTYLCDIGASELLRYWSYPITHLHSDVDSRVELGGVGASNALMSKHVIECDFSYQPGTSQRAGLVTLRLVLSDEGESITLLHQVHVYNTP